MPSTPKDRKEIVRDLVEKVVVHVKNDSEYVDITIYWHGGFASQHEVVRPVRTYEQIRDPDKLMDRIVALHHEGHTAAEIAGYLWADKQEVTRLRKLTSLSRRGVVEYPADLTKRKGDLLADRLSDQERIVLH